MKNYRNITRKKFIHIVGSQSLFLTVPFLTNCASIQRERLWGNSIKDPIHNAKEIGITYPILQAANAGITAPNPHNTQAWLFLIHSPMEMSLFVDRTRILPATDPATRQTHIGHGAFIELLSIGAKDLGYKTLVTLFPEGEYTLLETGQKPVARIKLIRSNQRQVELLYSAISRRATCRTPYYGKFISNVEYDKVFALTKPKYTSLRFVNNYSLMRPYLKLFLEGMAVEVKTRLYNEESRIWFRKNDEEIFQKRDGISLPGNGISGVKKWLIECADFTAKEEFHNLRNLDRFLESFRINLNTTKGLIFFITKGNNLKNWVLSGRDYVRFQLALTELGMVMQPLSQVLQEFDEMKFLRVRFEKMMKLRPNEKVQMIGRVGRSDYSFFSPRRILKRMIIDKKNL